MSILVSKPGADLSREDEIVAVEVADEQSAESGARALGIGEAADDEVLRRLALHLEPVLRSLLLVRRIEPLGDDAFPSLATRTLPRLGVVHCRHATQRRAKRQLVEQRAAFGERQTAEVVSVEPDDVEHVVFDDARFPGQLAVEDEVVRGKLGDRVLDRRNGSRLTGAREQADVGSRA